MLEKGYNMMKEYTTPETIFDITDEAFDMVDRRIDLLRSASRDISMTIEDEMSFLKDLRNLLRMQENFRDENIHLIVKYLMKNEEK